MRHSAVGLSERRQRLIAEGIEKWRNATYLIFDLRLTAISSFNDRTPVALELGRQADGSVTVVYALEYIDPEESLEPSVFDPCRQAALESRRRRQDRIDYARERLHAQLAGEARTWCEIEEVVAINRAYKEILQRASDSDADLIVMGAEGSGGIELMLYGSNTHHVVRAATCPVLTVRA